ncbi:MAG: IS66 family insertion sequence element accessory protein TnpB [Armatimonadetes bacterium]|nr:IS66 family insertion sequence element accessory protein TnpB [Armatimonadota bacterium]
MKRRAKEEWRKVVEGFAGSGRTVSAYCTRSGVKPASFYRWRAMLAQANRPRAARTKISRSIEPRAAVPFVDLGSLPAAPSRFELRVDLGHGVSLHLARS